jgi:hypothetical protein
MSGNSKGTLELIRVLNSSIHALGVFKVIRYLRWLTKNCAEREDIVEIVIFSVCEMYSLNPSELKDSQRTDGDQFDAMCLIAFLLKKHSKKNHKTIAELLDRHKSQVSRYMNRMANLKPDTVKPDRIIWENYLALNDRISKIVTNEIDPWEDREK